MAELIMRPDDLEFLIAQYADGSLDAKRSAELEAVLRRDEDARAILEAYRAINGALTGIVASQPVPEVQWDRLATSISRKVAALAVAGPMTDDEEESVSRYSSGDALEQELRSIDAKIAADPRSRLLLAEYAALDRTFDAVREAPMPNVRWEQFASHISAQIDHADDASGESMKIGPAKVEKAIRNADSSSVFGRIGNFFSQPSRLAIAACVVLAASISFKLINQGGNTNNGTPKQGGPDGSPIVTVIPAPVDIRVGPSFTPGVNPMDRSTVTSIHVGPPTGPGFDVAAMADWAKDFAFTRPSQMSIGKAATQPEDKPSKDTVENGALFPSR